eukprot:5470470-Prymnesium_polylepis.1
MPTAIERPDAQANPSRNRRYRTRFGFTIAVGPAPTHDRRTRAVHPTELESTCPPFTVQGARLPIPYTNPYERGGEKGPQGSGTKT